MEVVNKDGGVEIRSMIYTEYFVKGTQPTELCPLHPSPAFMDRVAGMFGGGESSKPVRAEDAGLPPTQTGTAGAHPAPAPASEVKPEEPSADANAEPQKKRGFWGRIFGRDNKRPDQRIKGSKEKRRRGRYGSEGLEGLIPFGPAASRYPRVNYQSCTISAILLRIGICWT